MKFLDCVKQSIYQYPGLYLSESFDKSKFRIMCDMFLTARLGNGVDWAKTRNPKKGGYVIEPKYYDKCGNWIRKFDKNYGIESFDIDIERYFKEDVYELCEIDKNQMEEHSCFEDDDGYKVRYIPIELSTSKYTYVSFVESEIEKIKSKYGDFMISILKTKISPLLIDDADYKPDVKWFAVIVKKNKISSPYPNFNKKYNPFWKPEAKYTQEDWKIAGIDFFSYLIHYFNTPELYKNYIDYKCNEWGIECTRNCINKSYTTNGIIDIEKVRKKLRISII